MTIDKDTGARAGDGKTLAVPFGMVLVPREPTMEMVNAFHATSDSATLQRGYGRARWDAMLDAAPAVAPLTLETAEEARADRAHAEAYYRQAEKLLTANEQALLAECDRLRGNLKSVWAKAQAAAERHGFRLVMQMPQEHVELIAIQAPATVSGSA